jgi:hypothetical protein
VHKPLLPFGCPPFNETVKKNLGYRKKGHR